MKSILNKNLKINGKSFALIFKKHGNPFNVLEKVDTTNEVLNRDLRPDELLVKFKASIINPVDINIIEGSYGILPDLPCVSGSEGCAEVLKIGSLVKNINVGDKVIPKIRSVGTWSTHALDQADKFTVVNKNLDYFTASQLIINPCTAYRMLKDFVFLKPDDTVIQNGANSAVGKYVIQLCKKWNLNLINVIRNREKKELIELTEDLKNLGADYIITEENLNNKEFMTEIFKKISKPNLLLNCVGGKNVTSCLKHLNKDAFIVTYGGMSKQPIMIPTGQQIFNNLTLKGFWVTKWFEKNRSSNEKIQMLDFLTNCFIDKSLKIAKPIKFKLNDYKEAIEKSMKSNVKGKVTFVFDD